jgi:hypothetical protein
MVVRRINPMPTLPAKPWTTKDEIEWLDSIGSDDRNDRKPPPIVFLRGYIEGAKKRVLWDNMDAKKCVIHANKLLMRETECL